MKKIYLLLAFIVLLAFPLAAQTNLFSFGSTWKYLDNGSNQGTAWRGLSFDDGSWKTGAGKFGYGYGDETTVLSFGSDPNNRYTTTYFRKELVLANASAFSAYTGSVKRDDGVVVYVNGVEVYRNNLPSGTISYTTLASSASDNGTTAINFNINAAAFQTGTNVIAVEVHQTSLKSFDKVFDLALSATGTGPGDTTPPAVSGINRQSPASQTTNATSLTFRATFSEAVTGVDAADFQVVLTSSATGTIGTVTPVSGSTYDVTVTGVGGNGTVGLNLKGSGTGIADAAGNPIAGGFTGQTYIIEQSSGGTTALFGFGSTWTYLDNGSNQGTAWRGLSFDDGSWKTGAGKFGYGYGDETTVLSFGSDPNNRYTTTYFRKELVLANASAFSAYTGSVKRDDGVVVYVNGVEVYRNNLPSGTISYTTLASSASDNGTTAINFNINAAAFQTGTNVIAVEVHQTSLKSFDKVFDLALSATGTGPGDTTPPAVSGINRQSPASQTTNATSLTFRATFSEAVTGVDAADFQVVLTSSATGTIGTVTPVSGSTYDVTVTGVGGNGTVGLNLKGSGTGIADAAGNPIAGGFTGQTYIIEQTPGDTTPPAVSGINRQSPAGQTTNATSLTFRATFSEAVTGVDAADFQVVLTSSATGTIGTVTPVSGSTYDVTVTGVGGNGTVGLNLKSSGTGIADAAGNPIAGGFTGQTYIIQQASTGLGFASVINLNPVDARVDATKEKQQAKVFVNRGRHWAIIPNSSGTFLWRLDGTTWTSILRLSTRNARADAVVKEDTTHIFLFAGPASELVSVEYIPATNTYEPWSRRRVKTDITLDEGVETGSITLDATGRMWLASDGLTTINVRYSDRPYTSWSGPVNIASGVSGDDICAVLHLPALNRIGILWSNQTTDRFGFRTHINGTSPTTWTADEVPASQSALNVGRGMSDDHLNMKVASDGTLYCAVKTSYDEPGFPVIALLIRRPTGSWDDLYEVAQNGTRPIVLLNEAQNKLKVVYTSQINGGDIQYKGSLMSAINFSPQLTLISGINNNVTSTHQNYTSEIVILASNTTQAVGVLASDVAPGRPEPGDSLAGAEQQVLRAFPNPFTTSARLRFQVPVAGPYYLAVYDGKGLVFQRQGRARAGEEQEVELAGASLSRGLYYVRLQTAEGVKTLKLVLDK